MKISDYIARFLLDRGVETVFGYSGGAVTHLMDSLNRTTGIRFLQTYHEQTAAIAAEGYSWISGFPGVALATSGPGATNMLTGIADAYFDSIPTLYLTGQVNTYEYKGEKPIRQQGFQETDIVSIARPVTKYAKMITDPLTIRHELEKAFYIAMNGRRGPVLLDIPMDIQRAEIEADSLEAFSELPTSEGLEYLDGFSPDELARLIKNSKRPLLLLGNGVEKANGNADACLLARRFQIPVVTSLLGKGCFPEDDSLSLGMIGSYGNRCANLAMANTDLLIAIGTRLDTRQTGTNLPSFVRFGKIIRLDIDKNEIKFHRLDNVKAVHGDATVFLRELSALSWNSERSEWLAYVARLKLDYGQGVEIARNVENTRPYEVMEILNRYSKPNQIFTVDIGQNQMFAAQSISIREGQSWKTSGGLAPMGFALPAAIGAAFASKKSRSIFAITGDGGLHLSVQSLLTVVQHRLPIKIILLNNRSLGMITQFQDLYFDSRREGTTKESGYLVPDFGFMARSCGLDYCLIKAEGYEDEKFLAQILTSDFPCLVEFDVGDQTVVYPKLEVNMPIEDQSPRLDPALLQKLMLIDDDK